MHIKWYPLGYCFLHIQCTLHCYALLQYIDFISFTASGDTHSLYLRTPPPPPPPSVMRHNLKNKCVLLMYYFSTPISLFHSDFPLYFCVNVPARYSHHHSQPKRMKYTNTHTHKPTGLTLPRWFRWTTDSGLEQRKTDAERMRVHLTHS